MYTEYFERFAQKNTQVKYKSVILDLVKYPFVYITNINLLFDKSNGNDYRRISNLEAFNP